MSGVTSDDLCRVTVVAPNRRIDLAVPASVTVAALLPVLLERAEEPSAARTPASSAGWILQRLGGRPFDPTGTPESLAWLDGEELHLRPAETPLPELDFDDLAEGIAAAVNRRQDRWRPEYRRPLFLALSVLVLGIIGAVLVDAPQVLLAGVGYGLAGAFAIASVPAAQRAGGRPLALVFALAACGYTGLTTGNLMDGVPGRLVAEGYALLVAAAATTAVALALLVLQWLVAPSLPYPALLAVLVTGASVISVAWLQMVFDLKAPQAAAVLSSALFGVIVFAPRVVLRAARLRGPQLPKTNDDLRYDIEPLPAPTMAQRANEADTYLSVLVFCSSLVQPALWRTVMETPAWVGVSLVGTLASALLLRVRSAMGLWQRLALTGAGSAGYAMIVLRYARLTTPGWRITLVFGLLVLAVVLLTAALRPWPQRLLPVWEFLATVGDVVTGLAVAPLVLYLLGVYSWARGLFG